MATSMQAFVLITCCFLAALAARAPTSTKTKKDEVNVCDLEKEIGLCYGSDLVYYYDKKENVCKEFSYGGCGGNENRFDTIEKCQETCVKN